MEQSKRFVTPALLVAALFVTVILYLPILSEPFGRDQGIFAYIGEGILKGYVPYRDAWDHKPPGIDFAYAAAFAVFGRGMVSVHLLELASIIATSLIMFLLGRRLFDTSTGLIGALLYGAGSSLMFEWWDRGQAEGFMTLPIALSMYCGVQSRSLILTFSAPRGHPEEKEPATLNVEEGSYPLSAPGGHPERARVRAHFPSHSTPLAWLFASGFFGGLSIYFKPTAGVMLAFVGLLLIADAISGRDILKGVLGIATLSLGALAAMVPLLAYFALNNALTDLYEAVIVFNTYHVQTGANLTLAQMIEATLDFGARMGFLAPLAALGAVTVILRKHAAGISTVLWFIFLMAGVWTQGKFFSYQWVTLLAPLALMSTVGLKSLWSELSPFLNRARSVAAANTRSFASLALMTLPVLALGYGIVLFKDQSPKMGRDLTYLMGSTTEQAYLANFGHNLRGIDVYSFSAAKETASYIAQRTSSQDTVLVWGFQALVNYLAERRSPTRYIFSYPLTIDQPDSDIRAKARKTFMDEIGVNKPKYIVLVTNDVNPLQAVDSVALLKGFPEFKKVVDADYALEKDIADFHIYVRKGSQ